jgi:hypothetical protein
MCDISSTTSALSAGATSEPDSELHGRHHPFRYGVQLSNPYGQFLDPNRQLLHPHGHLPHLYRLPLYPYGLQTPNSHGGGHMWSHGELSPRHHGAQLPEERQRNIEPAASFHDGMRRPRPNNAPTEALIGQMQGYPPHRTSFEEELGIVNGYLCNSDALVPFGLDQQPEAEYRETRENPEGTLAECYGTESYFGTSAWTAPMAHQYHHGGFTCGPGSIEHSAGSLARASPGVEQLAHFGSTPMLIDRQVESTSIAFATNYRPLRKIFLHGYITLSDKSLAPFPLELLSPFSSHSMSRLRSTPSVSRHLRAMPPGTFQGFTNREHWYLKEVIPQHH